MDAQPVTSGNFERRLRHILESLESEDSRLTGKAGRIYEALEKDLLTGRYKFGADISAPELAKRLGVSRQPVMAALSQLRAAGYVTITPQVGCRVVTPTTEEISDFFRLFGAMEGVMARLAAERDSWRNMLEDQELEWEEERAELREENALRLGGSKDDAEPGELRKAG